MTDIGTLDKRVGELEAFMTDVPEILNLRFDSMNATQSEITVRLNLLDKQVATLTRDVREMRAAVTRQLISQDERFKAVEIRLTALDERLASLEGRFTTLEGRFTSLEGRFTSLEGRFTSLEGRFTTLEERFTTLEGRVASQDARLASIDSKLDQVLVALGSR